MPEVDDTALDVKQGADGQVEDSETSKDSSSEQTEETLETGEVEKTQKVSDEDVEKELLESGDSIPFERFKKVIDQRNEARGQTSRLDTLQTELEEIKGNPDIYRSILKSQGITDDKILDQRMSEAGFEVKPKELPQNELVKQLTNGLDLKTTEGWIQAMLRAVDYGAQKHVAPINQKFSQQENAKFISEQEKGAMEIAKKFKIEYGKSGKDEGNINTAVGKIAKYWDEHPKQQDALAKLGHTGILKLALAEEGFTLGKQAGKQEEVDRLNDLKDSAMEDDAHTSTIKMPSPDASVQEINRFFERNEKKIGARL